MSEQLSPQAARQVLRRAVELASPAPDRLGYERAALEQAAAELGIDAAAVRQALAEHDAGLIEASSPAGRLLGPAEVRVVREVAVSPTAAAGLVRRWLRSQLLELHDRDRSTEIWVPRDDVMARIRRAADLRGRVRIGPVDSVRVTIVESSPGALIRLEADLHALRRGLRTGAVQVPAAAACAGGVAMTLVAGTPVFALAGVPVAAALGTLGAFGARHTLDRERAAADRAMRLFLDRLGG